MTLFICIDILYLKDCIIPKNEVHYLKDYIIPKIKYVIGDTLYLFKRLHWHFLFTIPTNEVDTLFIIKL